MSMVPHIALLLRFFSCFDSIVGRANSDYEPPSHSPQATGEPSQLAWAVLVMGIASWVILPLIGSVIGAILGKMELDKIKKGESPQAGKTITQVGFWLSVVNLVL